MATFEKQKVSCLSQVDLSKKGSIDDQIIDLVQYINAKENYFTTSSCSGRISVFSEVSVIQLNLLIAAFSWWPEKPFCSYHTVYFFNLACRSEKKTLWVALYYSLYSWNGRSGKPTVVPEGWIRLNVVERFQNTRLHNVWSRHILIIIIKPQTKFFKLSETYKSRKPSFFIDMPMSGQKRHSLQ